MDTTYTNEEDPTVAATTALANASLNDNYETHRRRHSREDSLRKYIKIKTVAQHFYINKYVNIFSLFFFPPPKK